MVVTFLWGHAREVGLARPTRSKLAILFSRFLFLGGGGVVGVGYLGRPTGTNLPFFGSTLILRQT